MLLSRRLALCLLLSPLLLLDHGLLCQGSTPRPSWQLPVKNLQEAKSFPLRSNEFGDGKEFTIEVRLVASALRKSATFLQVKDVADEEALKLEVAPSDRPSESTLRFLITSDFKPAPLSVGVPLRMLNLSSPHVVTLRDLGFRLDFFVDGVLADQEWPAGKVAAKGTRSVTIAPGVEDMHLWSSSLEDAAIVHQNGGSTAIAVRDRTIFGPAPTGTLQYFRPRGYNTNAGDPMPFYHDGVFHVFYLLDRRHHESKWGLGAHQWGHAATTDLVHWKFYPPALTIEHEWEASICTGSVFFEGGKYYAFYATRMSDRSEHLGMAVSDDAIHFTKMLPTPFEEPKPPFRRGPNRDPFVFGKTGDFHMLVTASLLAPPTPNQAGALEHLTSADLKTWKVESKPFLVTGYQADPECSDLFFWRGWYYLLFSEDGRARYRMSRNQLGPWTTPNQDLFDGIEARVMKTAGFRDDRRIGVAFIPDGWFGGQLVLREIIQKADGTLQTAFPHEMTPHGKPVPKSMEEWRTPEGGNIGSLLRLQPNTTANLQMPQDYKLTVVVDPASTTAHFGFRFDMASGKAESDARPTLDFAPVQGSMEWLNSLTFKDHPTRIEDVEDLHGRVLITMVAKGNLIDVDVNGGHTLIHRVDGNRGQELTAYCDGGEVRMRNLVIETLGGDH